MPYISLTYNCKTIPRKHYTFNIILCSTYKKNEYSNLYKLMLIFFFTF